MKFYGLVTDPTKLKIWGDKFQELLDVINSSQTFWFLFYLSYTR